ncbi:MAG: glycosyltransferase family protein [Zoogloeaceae bacterium]|jgi:glycosyltransferase involved in cell wall biosynthesis|nr:glycosyltransferase family protein [Zoogloeaceae bacterium]
MNAQPRFSVIICSIDAWKFTQARLCYERLLAGWPHEIIGIHDAASLAEGYNRGISRSRGDILIFSHDDILIIDPDFAAKISARMQTWAILGFAGTDRLIADFWFGAGLPHLHGVVAHPGGTHFKLSVFGVSDWPVIGNIQAVDGMCMIARRETAEATGFDAFTFDGFHLYDLDFSFAAHRAGHEIGVCCDIPVFHASTGDFDRKHQQYAERLLAKYTELKETPPEQIHREIAGRDALFRDHRAVIAAWRPDVLQRVGTAIRRYA